MISFKQKLFKAENAGNQHNYQIILGQSKTGRAKGNESFWGTGLIQDNLPFIQSGTAQPLVADFNGDGWDDIYLAAAVNDFGTGCEKLVFFITT